MPAAPVGGASTAKKKKPSTLLSHKKKIIVPNITLNTNYAEVSDWFS